MDILTTWIRNLIFLATALTIELLSITTYSSVSENDFKNLEIQSKKIINQITQVDLNYQFNGQKISKITPYIQNLIEVLRDTKTLKSESLLKQNLIESRIKDLELKISELSAEIQYLKQKFNRIEKYIKKTKNPNSSITRKHRANLKRTGAEILTSNSKMRSLIKVKNQTIKEYLSKGDSVLEISKLYNRTSNFIREFKSKVENSLIQSKSTVGIKNNSKIKSLQEILEKMKAEF